MSVFTECAMDGSGPDVLVTLDVTDLTLTVTKGNSFNGWANNPTLTSDGKTIGELNRSYLHRRLDEFLNGQEPDDVIT